MVIAHSSEPWLSIWFAYSNPHKIGKICIFLWNAWRYKAYKTVNFVYCMLCSHVKLSYDIQWLYFCTTNNTSLVLCVHVNCKYLELVANLICYNVNDADLHSMKYNLWNPLPGLVFSHLNFCEVKQSDHSKGEVLISEVNLTESDLTIYWSREGGVGLKCETCVHIWNVGFPCF